MSDQTIAALREIEAHAAEHGAIVDRVEVALRDRDGKLSVEFTAHYLPKPLANNTACVGYITNEGV